MRLREEFLKVSDIDKIRDKATVTSAEELENLLAEEKEYRTTPDSYCTMCASKDICLKRMKE